MTVDFSKYGYQRQTPVVDTNRAFIKMFGPDAAVIRQGPIDNMFKVQSGNDLWSYNPQNHTFTSNYVDELGYKRNDDDLAGNMDRYLAQKNYQPKTISASQLGTNLGGANLVYALPWLANKAGARVADSWANYPLLTNQNKDVYGYIKSLQTSAPGIIQYEAKPDGFDKWAGVAMGALATFATGGALAPWAAGALGGGTAGLISSGGDWGSALKGAALGGLGGGIAQGMSTTAGTWMDGISAETLKAAGYSGAEISALRQAATSGSIFGANGWNTTGNSSWDKILNNSATGAVKGGLTSGINGGNVWEGIAKGGLSSGVNSSMNAAFGIDSRSWNPLVNIGSGMATNEIMKNVFGNNNTSSTMSESSGGNMSNSITDWAGALSPFLSAYNTYSNMGNTSDAYKNAQQLVTTPSADQQMYRTQLASLMKNPGQMSSSPVYQAMFDQGMNAVNRTGAAKGMLGSGGRLSELMKVGQKAASQYYFPQQQALAQLSGVGGDAAGRALAAQAMIGGNSANTEMRNSMIKDLMGGMGVQTPTEQLINSILGKNGSNVNPLLKTVSGWFNGDSGYTGGEDFNNWYQSSQPTAEQNFWNASGSSPTALNDYTSSMFTPYDLTWQGY